LHGAGVGLDSLAIPTWMAGLADLLEGAMRSGEPLRRQLDEGMRHFMLSIQPCRLPSHESHGLLLQVDDISPFIVVQNDLRRSKTQLESILDSSAIHSVITNHAGRVEFASRGMTEWMDVPAQRLVGSVIWSHFDDASARLLRQRHAAAMASDNVVEFEEIIAAAGGTFRVLSVRVPLMDDAGNVNGVCWQVLDVSERERISKALADSEALSRAVLTAMPANIAVLDAGGRIVSVNEAWTRFAESNGAAATTWEGVDYLAYCDRPDAGPDHGGSLAAGIREVLEGRRDLFMHEYPCHSAEQQHWFRLLAAPLRTETGGAAVMHVDVTQTVAAQQALKAVNASLEARIEGRTRDLRQAVDELEMFSYSVSHDLRTPLRTLNGFSEILLKDHAANLDATGQSHLRRIAAAAARMSQYLDELLKLSHLTKGDLVIERVDLSAMVREIGNDEVARYPDRKTEFTVAEGLAADGDPDLVRAVLENLVGNAFKYTVGRNPTRITVGKLVHDGTEMFYVRDNGMGFDMSFRDKLFMPFQRLHSNVEIPGNGLGLAAAKRIVMRHGGQIFAEARPGFGATFYFTLR
jgi:PAS domain S-box-containing protein